MRANGTWSPHIYTSGIVAWTTAKERMNHCFRCVLGLEQLYGVVNATGRAHHGMATAGVLCPPRLSPILRRCSLFVVGSLLVVVKRATAVIKTRDREDNAID